MIKTCLEKHLSALQTLIVKMSLFVFNYKTVFSSACCSILEKMLKKLLGYVHTVPDRFLLRFKNCSGTV